MKFINLEAEMSILGTIMTNDSLIEDIQLKLTKEMFYKKENQILYNTFVNMYKAGRTIDIVTTAEECKPFIGDIGGLSYISELPSYSKENVKSYIDIVINNYQKREMMNIAENIITSLNKGDTQKAINLFEVGSDVAVVEDSNNNGSITEACDNLLNSIAEAKKNGGGIQGMKRGIASLDDRTNGKNKGNLDIIGARPGMGKTTFIINEMYGLIQNGFNVEFFSLEMSKEEIMLKLACRGTGLDSNKVQRGELTDEEMQFFTEVMIQIMNWNEEGRFKLYARKGRETDGTIEDIVAKIKADSKALRDKGKTLDVVYVDHISIIQTRRAYESERIRIKHISNTAKAIASELDINLTLLSQLSRACEQRTDKRPMLSDLRESGDIEQDADNVMFLYRDEYYNKETEDKGILECICSKVRMGTGGGTEKLKWLPQSSLVLDIDWRN